MKKSDFVHSRLSPLLRALDDDILAVSYGKVGTKEHVYIIFDGGYLEIDVSGLDNAGITELVTRSSFAMIEAANKIASDKLHRIEQEHNNELRRENAELRAMVRALLTAHTVEVEIEHGRAKFYDAAILD